MYITNAFAIQTGDEAEGIFHYSFHLGKTQLQVLFRLDSPNCKDGGTFSCSLVDLVGPEGKTLDLKRFVTGRVSAFEAGLLIRYHLSSHFGESLFASPKKWVEEYFWGCLPSTIRKLASSYYPPSAPRLKNGELDFG